MDLLQILVKGSVLIFVVSSMLSIGLAARVDEIVAPLRRPVWVLRALLVNFVLAPVVVANWNRFNVPLNNSVVIANGVIYVRHAVRNPA